MHPFCRAFSLSLQSAVTADESVMTDAKHSMLAAMPERTRNSALRHDAPGHDPSMLPIAQLCV